MQRKFLNLPLAALLAAACGSEKGELDIIEVVPVVTAESMAAGPDDPLPLDVNVLVQPLKTVLGRGGSFDLLITDCAAPEDGEAVPVYLGINPIDRASSSDVQQGSYAGLRVMVPRRVIAAPNRCARFVGRDGLDLSSRPVPMPR